MLPKLLGTFAIPVITFVGAYTLLVMIGFAENPRTQYCPQQWVRIWTQGLYAMDPTLIAERYIYRNGKQVIPEPPVSWVLPKVCGLEVETITVDPDDFTVVSEQFVDATVNQ